MKKAPTIFISYNSHASNEETLAVRLQTIGAVNGFTTLLPDRFSNKNYVDEETRRRIFSADYFILFSSRKVSQVVRNEIDIAFEHFNDPSKIIVIYNPNEVSNLNIDPNLVTLISFNPQSETVDIVINKIVLEIQKKESGQKTRENQDGFMALLVIGLGLVALATFFGGDDD